MNLAANSLSRRRKGPSTIAIVAVVLLVGLVLYTPQDFGPMGSPRQSGALAYGVGSNASSIMLNNPDLNMMTVEELSRASSLGETQSKEGFHKIVHEAFQMSVAKEQKDPPLRRHFDIRNWQNKSNGGLNDEDRVKLAQIYGNASSVFEYGLGESTLIAGHVGVPRYAGIDSDSVYVSDTRAKLKNSYFRFYFADVGSTKAWGFPSRTDMPKNPLNYQLAPLISEPEPFDVYMVDGRWRQACLAVSFLHASARGAPAAHTIVLVHDCQREDYHSHDHLFYHLQSSGSKICAYQRKPSTTDEDLVNMWKERFNTVI